MVEDIKFIDTTSLRTFASRMEALRASFADVGGPSSALSATSAAVAEPFVTAFWEANAAAVDTVARFTTTADRGFHGIGYMAVWFGDRIADLDADKARELLRDAHKAVPGPRDGLPEVDPRFDRRA